MAIVNDLYQSVAMPASSVDQSRRNLTELLDENNLTVVELSRRIGSDNPSYLYRFLREGTPRKGLNGEVVALIAKELEVDSRYVTGELEYRPGEAASIGALRTAPEDLEALRSSLKQQIVDETTRTLKAMRDLHEHTLTDDAIERYAKATADRALDGVLNPTPPTPEIVS